MHSPFRAQVAFPRIRAQHLVVLYLIALAVRVVGVWWGAPYGDERPQYAARVLVGELVPADHFYPPLLYYIHAVAYVVLFAVGRLVAMWHDLGEFREAFFERPHLFTVTCRLVVAMFAAGIAPLGAIIARRLGVGVRWAWVVGLVIGLHPVSVWWSHVSKPQMPMATGVFLMTAAVLYAVDRPGRRRPWIYLGLAIAIAVAFKQTAAFFALSMTLGLGITQAVVHRIGFRELLTRGGLLGLSALLLWCPLSVGVLMDLEGFIAYQEIQAAMSNRSASFGEIAGLLVPMLGSTVEGATWPGLLIGLAAPFLNRSPKHLLLFGSNVSALVLVVMIAGPRITPALLLPFTGLFLLHGVIACALYAQAEGSRPKRVGQLGVLICLAGVTWGTQTVVVQALRPPMGKRVVQVLDQLGGPAELRILASKKDYLGVPIAFTAQEEERQRHERLAQKYGVALPERPPERSKPRGDQSRAFHVREFPWATHGLEVYTDEELDGAVRALAWPIQPEEWSLDYWRDRGFRVFIVMDLGINRTVPIYRAFFQSLREQAELVAKLETKRELFFETTQWIYRLRDESTSSRPEHAP